MKKIHIVEDDDYKLESLERVLKDYDCIQVVISKSFSSAAKQIKKQNFDLLILDMSLPKNDLGTFNDDSPPEGLGGKRLVRISDEYDKLCPTILFTQFENYSELGKVITVEQLSYDIQQILGEFFLGIIRYTTVSVDWENNMRYYLDMELNK